MKVAQGIDTSRKHICAVMTAFHFVPTQGMLISDDVADSQGFVDEEPRRCPEDISTEFGSTEK